jgi:protein phosphatase
MMEHSMQFDAQVYGNLPFRWAVCSDTGRIRQVNEDAHLVEPETGLFVVSDGMGGHPGGKIASEFVVSDLSVTIDTELHKLRSVNQRAVRRLIKKAIYQHSNQVIQEGQSEAGFKGMGATVVLALLHDGRVTIANLGDSRIYRYRNGRLMQLSQDHSVINELIQEGKLLPEYAQDHDAEGIITQYMGMKEIPEPHIRSFGLHPEDRLLLCSDGLTAMLSDKTIQMTLSQNLSPQKAVQSLVDQANEAGGYDNITVVVIDWSSKPGL